VPVFEVEGSRLRIEPLWARVDRNRVKLAVFVVLFVAGAAFLLATALVAVPGMLIGVALTNVGDTDPAAYWPGFAVTFAGALAVLLVAGALLAAAQLSNAEHWVSARFKGRVLGADEQPALRSAVDDIVLSAGLSAVPRILVLDTPGTNAFALGTRSAPVIGVTQGFLGGMGIDQQRAVVATLVARIISGDIWFGTALAALMGPLKAIRESYKHGGDVAGAMADAGCSDPGCGASGLDEGCGCLVDGMGDSDSAGGCLGAVGVVVFAVVVAALTYAAVVTAAWIVTLWGRALHRTTYEKADAEGMLLLKDPRPMLGALAAAVASSNEVGESDSSYDAIFYAATSGTPRVERLERRRYDRLREVLGVEGIAAPPLPPDGGG